MPASVFEIEVFSFYMYDYVHYQTQMFLLLLKEGKFKKFVVGIGWEGTQRGQPSRCNWLPRQILNFLMSSRSQTQVVIMSARDLNRFVSDISIC